MSILSTAGSWQIDPEPKRMRILPVARQQYVPDLMKFPTGTGSLPITVGIPELVKAHLTTLHQSDGFDWRLDPGLSKLLSQLGTDQELHVDGDLTAVPSSDHDSDDEPDLKAIAAPHTLFHCSESITNFADKLPTLPSSSISLQYYLQHNEDVLPRLAGLDQRCNDTRGLFENQSDALRRPWHSELREILPGLLVIDCYSIQVVIADPRCTYVALSYVWGRQKGRRRNVVFKTDLRGRRLPRTIRDAMNVVRVLGLRYLWVDRYCINNSEPGVKHHTISNMDSIYDAGYLTIIAAAGGNDEHGLPSVSRTFRALDEDVTPPWDGIVHSEFSEPHLRQFKNSKYSTRGWTFQEDLLSPRRLIFTYDRATLYYRHEDRVRNASGIFAHINEYSRREMTEQSDLLKAFLGVFRAYERLRPQVKHIWGLPILLDRAGNMKQPGYGLLWEANRCCSLSRISGMPSWTWAGWSGWSAVGGDSILHCPKLGPYAWLADKVPLQRWTQAWEPSDISLEVENGVQPTDIADFFRAGHSQPSGEEKEPAPVLYLTAWSTTVNVRVSLEASVHISAKNARLVVDPRPEILHQGQPLVNGQWNCQWTAAIICWAAKDAHDITVRTLSLLLERVGEDTYRRVGVLRTDWHKSDLDEQGRIAALDRSFTRTRLRIV